MKKNHIALNIRLLREYAGLKQGDFGALFNVSRDNVASYERGSVPSIDTMIDIVNYFHISLDDLVIDGLTTEKINTKNVEKVKELNLNRNPDQDLNLPKMQKRLRNEDVQPVEAEHIFRLRTDRLIDRQQIPIYDMEAVAGLVSLFTGDYSQQIVEFVETTLIPKCDGGLRIVGDSMDPLLKSGDVVFYRRIIDIPNNLLWGEMYLISFDMEGDEYITVKYLHKSKKKDHVILKSHNERHAPQELHISRIRALALVKASLRVNALK